MKKFIINLVVFGLFSLVFYVVIMPLWSSALPYYMSKNVRSCMGCYGHTFTRMQEAQQVSDVDVLIIGSSHAYRGIDPRVLKKYGINAYNLGSSAQTPINTKALLHQYLELINPKLVIYESYAGTLANDGLESSLDLLSNNKIDIQSIEMAREINKLVTYNTLIFSGFRQIFGLNKHFKEPQIIENDTYIPQTGFVEIMHKDNIFNQEKFTRWNMLDHQKVELENNVNYIKSKGVEVYIIQTPITKYLYESIENHDEVDAYLQSLGNYKNYQNLIELNDSTDFYDSNHLNQVSVEKFNELLA